MRLRTLPLAFSSIIAGSGLAYAQSAQSFSHKIFSLTLLTTLFLQILSNLANDYGDAEKGTDNAQRIGPARAIQSGEISFTEMKLAMVVTTFLSLGFGLWLIAEALQRSGIALFFFAIGIAAIAAAIKYTVGKNAYGYKGLGDLFVFLFFGIVGVCGSYFLQTNTLKFEVGFAAIALGAMATTVLHLNNMRDIENDAESGKITVAVQLGLQHAKRYFYALVMVATAASLCTMYFFKVSFIGNALVAISLIPFFISAMKVQGTTAHRDFDPLLKVNALGAFGYAVAMSVAVVCFSS